MATNCAAALGLTSNQPGSFNDLEQDLDEAAASAQAAWDIAQIGAALLLADAPAIPILPLVSLGYAIYSIVSLFGGGRPQMQDTDNVIWAYNMSAYWPLHALASDLTIAARNGAPISDSRPEIQAQFSAWKQGTIQSIQQVAGWPPGAQSPGYWQLQRLIDASWALSGQGQTAVLNAVRAIDRMTQILACLFQQSQQVQPQPSTTPGTQPGTQPTPQSDPCNNAGSDYDEIYDSCVATQNSLGQILTAIQALNTTVQNASDPACCTQIVAALMQIVTQLVNIAGQLTTAPATPPGVDLTAITTALQELVTAVAAYPPALEACCNAVTTQLSAIATALGPNLGPAVQNIADAINQANADHQVPESWISAFLNAGIVPPQMSGLVQGTTWEQLNVVVGGLIGYLAALGTPDPDGKSSSFTTNYIVPIGRAIWNLLTTAVLALVTSLGTTPANIAGSAQQFLQGIDAVFTTIFGGAANLVIQGYEADIAGIDTTTDAGIQQVVQILMGRAFESGMLAHIIAFLPEIAYFTKQLGLNATAGLIAEFAGFREVLINTHRPFMVAALGRPATYLYNRNYPTTMPAGPQALALWARRKIVTSDAQHLMASAGYNAAWQTPMFAGAYRPVTPFVLASAFVDQPIQRDVILDILQDNAYSPSHANTMADAIVYKSIANVRNSYLSALISGYQKGVVGDDELQQALTDFNFSPQAQQYVQSHVLILRREVLAQKVQSEVVSMVAVGAMSPDQGLQQLEAAGIQPWLAELEITLAATKATVAAAKKELALEAKTALQEQRSATRAAVAEFQRGVINEAGLTAALTLLGLDPALIVQIVAVQDATRTGRMKLVYGQLLSPADARVLTERVGAIETQIKETLITSDQGLAQLKALGVDDADANAIVARAAAALAAASTRGTLLSPITGQPP
jgi:hypothetical protein